MIETVREKFTCRDCEAISQPPAPFHATPRGFIGPHLLATIPLRQVWNAYAAHPPEHPVQMRGPRAFDLDAGRPGRVWNGRAPATRGAQNPAALLGWLPSLALVPATTTCTEAESASWPPSSTSSPSTMGPNAQRRPGIPRGVRPKLQQSGQGSIISVVTSADDHRTTGHGIDELSDILSNARRSLKPGSTFFTASQMAKKLVARVKANLNRNAVTLGWLRSPWREGLLIAVSKREIFEQCWLASAMPDRCFRLMTP